MTTLLPTPPGIDYHCRTCGKRATEWTARVNPNTLKLELSTECCGNRLELKMYLGIGGIFPSEWAMTRATETKASSA